MEVFAVPKRSGVPAVAEHGCRPARGFFGFERRTGSMVKIFDRVLLFLYSLTIAAAAVYIALDAFGWLPSGFGLFERGRLTDSAALRNSLIAAGIVWFVVSLRFLYLCIRSGRTNVPSIDQRNAFGDIRISLETIENLTLKAASRVKEAKDLKARVHVSEDGLELTVRAVADGESPLPDISGEMQRVIKTQVEEITGIPVSKVSVYIANIAPAKTMRSRVE
jgi:uncharacterized alkaline shock family protein YloU